MVAELQEQGGYFYCSELRAGLKTSVSVVRKSLGMRQ